MLAATEKAACLRAIYKFRVSREEQRELRVEPAAAYSAASPR